MEWTKYTLTMHLRLLFASINNYVIFIEMKNKVDELCKDHAPQPAETSNKFNDKLFNKSLDHFVTGMVRIEKDDLMQTFDFGLPPNVSSQNLCPYSSLIIAHNLSNTYLSPL